ncbi:MAG: Nif3-like dinuclear metal center hexameric protein [Specibacter sp.]
MSTEPLDPTHDGGPRAGAQGGDAVETPEARDDAARDASRGPEGEAPDTGLDAEFDESLDADDSPGSDSPDDGGAPVSGEPEAGELGTPVLAEVLLAVEELWPESLAEDWDKVGLVVGRPDAEVDRIMFAVDPTLEVIDEALEWGAKLLITHHPLLLKGVNSVAATSGKGRAVHRLIEGGCALLTVHTNGDSAVGGVSDVLSDVLGLTDVQPLMPAPRGLVEEGIGRVGLLPGAEKLGSLAARIFLTLPAVAGGVRVAGDRDALVRKVAVCGGAGDSLFDAVRASDADVFVTADLRHHPASEAREASVDGRPYLIDLSHFASEWLWLPAAAQALGNVLGDQGFEAEMVVSQTNTDPWDFILTPGN